MNAQERLVLFGDLRADIIDRLYTHDCRGGIKHVPYDIRHIYVHFYDDQDVDIGNLGLATALHSLDNDVWQWHDGGPEDPETGECGLLDLTEAVRVELQGH